MIPKGLKRLATALQRQDPIYDLQQTRRCDFYEYDSSGAIVVGACALGKIALEFSGAGEVLARLSEGIKPEAFIGDILKEVGLQETKVLHPLAKELWDLADAIINLNDEEQWSFAEIAVWLEQEADRITMAQRSLTQSTLW